MTTETHPKDVDKEKQRMAGAISGGIFLISLGILLATGWWWPGIMVALGLSSGAALIFRGKTWQGIFSLAFFCGIAVVVEIVRSTDISWGGRWCLHPDRDWGHSARQGIYLEQLIFGEKLADRSAI